MEQKGEWKTINGAHVLIKDGQSVDEAFDKRGSSAKSGSIVVGKGETKEAFKSSDYGDGTYTISKSLVDYCEKLSDEKIAQNQGWISAKSKEDEILKDIIKLQEFDKHPKIVSENEIKHLVSNGGIGFLRGMKIPDGAELYRRGDMYVGRGVSGNGVYAAAFTNGEDYTDISIALQTAQKYAGFMSGNNTGSIILGTLAEDAKIISKGELIQIRDNILPSLPAKTQRALYNLGRFAAAIGYDCIDCDNNSYIVILNRGKTIVAE